MPGLDGCKSSSTLAAQTMAEHAQRGEKVVGAASVQQSMPKTPDQEPDRVVVAALIVLVLAAVGLVIWYFGNATGTAESGSARAGRPAPTTPAQSHAQMVQELNWIADRTGDEHPYLGDQHARRLRRALQNTSPQASARELCSRNFETGLDELRLGNLRPAISCITRAYELIPAAKLDAQTADYIKFKLAVAYTRLGETENWCAAPRPENAILPLQPGALYAKLEAPHKALQYLGELMQVDLDNRRKDPSTPFIKLNKCACCSGDIQIELAARWLINFTYMTLGGYPGDVPQGILIPPAAFESTMDFPRFVNVAPKLGLDTFNLCGGAIVDDFDNDGNFDIVTSSWDPREQIQFFRNDADGTFSNHTVSAGLNGLRGGLNILQTDYDNDGNLDIFVLRGAWLGVSGQHPNSLIRNNGDGTFTDVTLLAGLDNARYPTQAAGFADYDNDGDLDLYIGNEHAGEMHAPSQLFRNNGDGTFTDVATDAGVQNFRFAKGVSWGDFDRDRFPDLYVSNYGAPNRLYRNNRDGTFTDVAPALNVTKPSVSFPTWFWDFDNDGVLDLFVASYTGRVDNMVAHYLAQSPDYEPACLYRGDGKGGFTDVAKEQGLHYPMLPMGSNFGDLDNDGYLDFYLGTGDPEYASLMPNLMFLNRGGKGFVDVTMAGGFGHLQKGHGVAFADLDNDGDADIFEQMGGAFAGDRFGDALYENPGFGNHWIGIELQGQTSNRAAIGARIRVEVKAGDRTRSVFRDVNSGGSFGANPLRQTIGLGKAEQIESVEIFWPATGRAQTFRGLAVDCVYRIVEDETVARIVPAKTVKLGG